MNPPLDLGGLGRTEMCAYSKGSIPCVLYAESKYNTDDGDFRDRWSERCYKVGGEDPTVD